MDGIEDSLMGLERMVNSGGNDVEEERMDMVIDDLDDVYNEYQQ